MPLVKKSQQRVTVTATIIMITTPLNMVVLSENVTINIALAADKFCSLKIKLKKKILNCVTVIMMVMMMMQIKGSI